MEYETDDFSLDNQKRFSKTIDILDEIQRQKRIDRLMEVKVPQQEE